MVPLGIGAYLVSARLIMPALLDEIFRTFAELIPRLSRLFQPITYPRWR
jgi:hypothetical protein